MEGKSGGPGGGTEGPGLPLYGAVGWRSGGGHVAVNGLRSFDADDEETPLSAEVRQTSGEATVHVTSFRLDRIPIEELQERTLTLARSLRYPPGPSGPGEVRRTPGGPDVAGPVAWSPALIHVDGVATDFRLAALDGGWAAVGVGPLSVIAVAAHQVPSGEIALERLPELESRPALRRRRRPPRPRRFPPEALTAEPDALGPANVELVYSDDRLVGTYEGLEIDLELQVPRSRSRTTGRFAGADLAAIWQLDYGHPELRARMHGRFADQTVTATGTFRRDDDWAIEDGTIAGHVGAGTIEAAVTALDGGLNETGTVAVDGHLGGTSFALAATVSGDLRHAIVVGTVRGEPVRLDTRRRSGSGRRTLLSGRYHGPPVLLALIAPALLHFI